MWTLMPSPVGDLRIVERDGSIVAIEFSPFRQPADGRPLGPRSDDEPVLAETVRQLTAYFDGTRTDFDLPLAPVGTDFQHRVWEQLSKIPHGETASYGEIAGRLQGIYAFCRKHLIEASIEQNPAKIEEVSELLTELRDAWAEIADSGATKG